MERCGTCTHGTCAHLARCDPRSISQYFRRSFLRHDHISHFLAYIFHLWRRWRVDVFCHLRCIAAGVYPWWLDLQRWEWEHDDRSGAILSSYRERYFACCGGRQSLFSHCDYDGGVCPIFRSHGTFILAPGCVSFGRLNQLLPSSHFSWLHWWRRCIFGRNWHCCHSGSGVREWSPIQLGNSATAGLEYRNCLSMAPSSGAGGAAECYLISMSLATIDSYVLSCGPCLVLCYFIGHPWLRHAHSLGSRLGI